MPNEVMEQSKFQLLFLDELKDMYWAEQAMVKVLPKMARSSTSTDLKNCFESHLKETQAQVKRLERAFKLLEAELSGKKCEAMNGLIAEVETVIADTEADSMVRDAALIIAAQKVEHYEIATYGSLCALARQMDHLDVSKLLDLTLEEEKDADDYLNNIALSFVNEEASQE